MAQLSFVKAERRTTNLDLKDAHVQVCNELSVDRRPFTPTSVITQL